MRKRLCILLCLCVLFTITADASDSQLNMDGRKLVLHQKFDYENGKLTHSEEYEYDSHGRKINTVKSCYSSDGIEMLYDIDFEYDENDNIIRAYTARSHASDFTHEYQYDSHGNMLQATLYMVGHITQRNYEYDTQGNLLLMTESYKEDNKPDFTLSKQKRYIYTYDAQGNLTQMTVTTDDDYFPSQYKYEYDTQGNLIREIRYYSDGTCQYEYAYDSHGNIVLQTEYHYDKNITGQIKYKYDAQDNLVRETAYNSDGDMIYQTKYKYNAQGDIIAYYKRYPIEFHSSRPYIYLKLDVCTYRYKYTWITIE